MPHSKHLPTQTCSHLKMQPPPRRRPIEIEVLDRRSKQSKKWHVPLTEELFLPFFRQGNNQVKEVFGDGSLFSPLLFGKFFDPADAFPLWDFESHTLLPIGGKVDWDETDVLYTLKSELPRGGMGVGGDGYELEICVESGKVVEMSRQMRESAKDWRKDKWWEYGHVRRLELPTNADWKRAEAYDVVEGNVMSVEIKIPKNTSESNTTTTSTN